MQKIGKTVVFDKPPIIVGHAGVAGKKEGEGPLAAEFDELSADNRFGQSSWEAAETYLQLRAARLCLQKAALPQEKVQLALAGDLQAQCTASSYAMRELGVPFAGLFGACSTMAEALGVGACLCSAGMADGLLAMTSSHFCTAERQFRTPLSYGAVWASGTSTTWGPPWLRLQRQRSCATSLIPTPNRRSSTPSAPATWAMWAVSCSGSCWPPRACSSRTMWTAVPSSMMPRASRCTAALLGRGAVQQCSAGISCPGWSGGGSAGFSFWQQAR